MQTSQRPVAVITGAGGAIGGAVAKRFAAAGAHVVLADLDVAAAIKAASALAPADGQSFEPIEADMGDNDSVRALAAKVMARFGRIDWILNNAAINHRKAIDSVDLQEWDLEMAVNLRGPMLLTQLAIPSWKENGGGRVVNVASRAWVAGGPPGYATSKAGIVGLTRSLSRQLAPFGTTANAVAPGLLATQFTQVGRSDEQFDNFAGAYLQNTPLKRLTLPEDVAGAVAFLVSSDASYITGEVIHVCGGSQMAPLG